MSIEIKENIALVNYTTFRIGGEARYFCMASNVEEIKEAVLWAREKGVPYFILGGGSNLLVSDNGFDGLVIKVVSGQLSVVGDKIKADAGVLLSKLVAESMNNNLTGLEWAVGIPGTIGGAVCGNAGAYGRSTSEIVAGGTAINSEGQIVKFDKNSCCFCYRGSAFVAKGGIVTDKNRGNGLIIAEVELKLEQGDKEKSQVKIKEILMARRNKIPALPSAGSFFRNYVLQKNDPQNDPLLLKHPELKTAVRSGKIGVGYLIEQCGLMGKTMGGAQISEQHSNFIVNLGGATAADVLELVKLCKEKVKEKFGIEIEEEKRYLGFENC